VLLIRIRSALMINVMDNAYSWLISDPRNIN
jgi:hypothetical protein